MEVENTTKITLAWELFEAHLPKSHIAKRLRVNRETIHLWVSGISSHSGGLLGFLNDYMNARKGERAKRKVDELLKIRIWKLRDENNDCCGQKIQKYLKDQYKISLGVKAIYKILGEKYELRSKWKKNKVRGPVPHASKPREVIQMDTVDFGEVFAFTAVDIFAKDVNIKLYPSLTSLDGYNFLVDSFENRFKYSDLIQTDGGPEFKDQFTNHVDKYCDRHRVARPYKKNEQSYIESFNRSLRKECLGWGKYKPQNIINLQEEINNYMDYYHDKRAHLGLNLRTPNEILKEYQVSDF